jgi:hypothetical protein
MPVGLSRHFGAAVNQQTPKKITRTNAARARTCIAMMMVTQTIDSVLELVMWKGGWRLNRSGLFMPTTSQPFKRVFTHTSRNEGIIA